MPARTPLNLTNGPAQRNLRQSRGICVKCQGQNGVLCAKTPKLELLLTTSLLLTPRFAESEERNSRSQKSESGRFWSAGVCGGADYLRPEQRPRTLHGTGGYGQRFSESVVKVPIIFGKKENTTAAIGASELKKSALTEIEQQLGRRSR